MRLCLLTAVTSLRPSAIGVGQRLFEIDVLARLGGGDGVGGVPEIGRDDEDAVDVLAGQQLAVVTVGLDALRGVLARLDRVDLLGQPLGVLHPVGVDVADGGDPGPGLEAPIDELLHVALALAADADAAELQDVARGRPGEHGRRDDGRGRRRHGRGLQEVSTVHAGLPGVKLPRGPRAVNDDSRRRHRGQLRGLASPDWEKFEDAGPCAGHGAKTTRSAYATPRSNTFWRFPGKLPAPVTRPG